MADLVTWVDGLGPVLQGLLLLVIGVVPFLESYVGGAVGVVLGVWWPLALAAPVVGNTLAIVAAVALGGKVKGGPAAQRDVSPRRRRIIERTEKWGVPVASLLAPLVLAISLTAFIMVAAGLDRRAVLVWNVVASVVWGALTMAIVAGVVQGFS